MKTLYLDIFSGISGDMFIGAMIDLGVDPGALEKSLRLLDLHGYHLHHRRAAKSAIEGVKFDVHLAHDHQDHGHEHHAHHHHEESHSHGAHGHSHGHHHHHADDHHHDHEEHHHGRSHREIRDLIQRSKLSAKVRDLACAVFQRIAVAEGRVHGVPPEEVHFHEVGAVDSIVDVVGACIALEMLGFPRVECSPVVEGTGFIQCQHGRFPIPAPATLAILGGAGLALSQCEEPHELVTPTGAALLAEFVQRTGPMRDLVASRIGIGLGTRDNKTRPNVLRAVLGESTSPVWDEDTVVVLETNLDDSSPEVLGHFVTTALAAGALDVWQTPVLMKKNRPGVVLSLMCLENQKDQFIRLILEQTSAFGVRQSLLLRSKLQRSVRGIVTKHGLIEVKFGYLGGKLVQTAPEYESCRKASEALGITVREVYAEALLAARTT